MKSLADMKHVIWLQTSFLGDIILTTAAFRYVKSRYPGIKQSLITTPLGAAALKGHPDLDQILVFDKRGRTLFAEAKRLRQELRSDGEKDGTVLLQCHRSFRSSLLARCIGFPVVTYYESELAFLAKRRIPRVAVQHEVQRILVLLEALGEERSNFVDAMPCLPGANAASISEKISAFAGDKPIVGIAPGSVWGTKRWPADNYGLLAEKLLDASEAAIVIIGSREEVAAADDMLAKVSASHRHRVLNLAGQTSLDDLRALYPQLKLLISNDSSPLHYASAFRVPTLAIFGATVPALGFGPLAPGSRVAEVDDLPCRPCSDHGPQTCPLGHFQCMIRQGPEALFYQAMKMLQAA